MINLIDYVKANGNYVLEEKKMNEIDDMIFARISYMPFKYIDMCANETIESIATKMKDLEQAKYIWADDKPFLQELGKAKRYKDIVVTDYVEILDNSAEKQFAAITINLPKIKYISYRGTDSTLVGWKEDFNMSFMENVPSQIESVVYLNDVAKKYKEDFILGGHSKGGNLAVYAAVFCEDEIKPKIKKIINADGPGFDKSVIQTPEYRKVLKKIETYIPQSSVVGRLIEHEEEYQVIKSNQKGFMKHDIFSWEIEGDKLVRIERVTTNSEIFNGILRDWLKNTTPEERKDFIDMLYEIILTTKATEVSDFRIDTVKKIGQILTTYKNRKEEDKKEIEKMIKLLISSTIKIIRESRRNEKVK